jgi:beta-glucanase (GH16 family)
MLSTRAQVLVWEENFDGTAINPNNWTFDFGDGCERGLCGWGNNELQYYTSRPENARLENGNLVIEARRETFGSRPFTSARMKTFGRVQFKYGTLEARIKVPDLANGLWPAFWMLGSTGVWPASGEIDIMEMGNVGAIRDGVINKRAGGAVHWENANTHAMYSRDHNSATDLTNDYHVYKMTWDAQFIRMYIDGIEYFSFDITGASAADLEEFHQSQYIILNLAVGGQYTGINNPEGITAPLPGKMLVDYIRLYQNQGDELYLGKDNALAGNYGIYTENPAITNKVTYGQDANLYIWNNLANIAGAAPFEGTEVLALRANPGNWFGMGVDALPKNLINFENGSLKFHFKTTYNGQFRIGIKSGHGETWINFPAGSSQFGLVRDGQWHEVTIPMSAFQQPNMGMHLDLGSVTQLLMFAGDAPGAAADFYFDNIYYSGGVAANPAPTVSITSPAADALITTPANITITADAADANGSVTKVDFYNGGTLLGSDDSAPYSFTWNGVAPGVYNLVAKATDNEGVVTTSKTVTIFVASPNNTPPTVVITAPAANADYTKPANITIQVNATDGDGSIYKVDFYNGNTLLGTDYTAPYSYAMSGVGAGSYALTAVATDNGKVTTTSAPVTVVVKDNTVVADKYGIYSNDGAITQKLIYGQDANLYIWNNLAPITGAAPYEGADVLALRATAGNWFGMGIDNEVKNVAHFANGSLRFHFKTVYNGQFRIGIKTGNGESWVAFENGVEKYGLLRNGQWNEVVIPLRDFANLDLSTLDQAFMFAGDAPAGTADFYIDNIYYSAQPINQAPAVNITAPANNASFGAPATVIITATATDADGTVAKVEFYNGNTLLGTDMDAPYSYNWSNVAAGTYTITAKATDNSNASTTSAGVSITVTAAATGGPNLALNKPITASSVENGGTPATSANDGNLGTRWSSAFSDPQWIAVDLGAKYDIGQVKITWEGAYGKDYRLEVSDDGTNWTMVKNITGNTTLVNDHRGLTATGRHVRIYGTQRALPYGYSIFELEVYGTPAQAYCETAPNGDYSYKAVTEGGNVNFTFHPLGATAGGNLAIIYIREGANGGYPGYMMTKNDKGDFTFSKPIANGTPLSIYFTYQVGAGGLERNSAATPHSYTVGTTCGAAANKAPVVTLTAPAANSSFTAPADIVISANATDEDGTIAKVEFFEGANLIGTDQSSPFTFNWNGVAAGSYSITAKATDNTGASTTSAPVSITVSGTTGGDTYCGTAPNGDYSYKAVTSGSNVTITFHPLAPIAGSDMAIVYPKPAAQAGPPPGYGMAKQPNGDFTYTISGQTPGMALSIYFTYAVPSGGERNSAANPHTYTVGQSCGVTAPVITIAAPASLTAPAGVNCTAIVNNLDPVITPATDGVQVAYAMTGATVGNGTGSVSGKAFNKGVTTVTYSLVSDPTKTASFTVTVADQTAPVPAVASLPSINGSCSVTVSETPTATDNCGGTITATTTDPLSYTAQGTYTITWTYNDGNGNTSSQTQTVVVSDVTAPVVQAPTVGLQCYNSNGYTISKLIANDNCGIGQVSYSVTGATIRSGEGADASGAFNAGSNTITWTVIDINGNTNTAQTEVVVNPEINVTIADAWALTKGVEANTVYLGYAPASSLHLQATATGGSGSYTYQWSAGGTGAATTVHATNAGTQVYTLLVNDGNCEVSVSKTIEVRDIRCGNNYNKVQVCHAPQGNPSAASTLCVSANAVAAHLEKGSYLGACKLEDAITMARTTNKVEPEVAAWDIQVLPNPSATAFKVSAIGNRFGEPLSVRVLDATGRVKEVKTITGQQTWSLGANYRPGLYFLEVVQGKEKKVIQLIKQ